MRISEVKRSGRRAMRGKRGGFAALCAVTLAAAVGWALLPLPLISALERTGLPTGTAGYAVSVVSLSLLTIAASGLFIAPLKIGGEAWLLRAARGKSVGSSAVMYWYAPSRALKAALLRAAIAALKCVWAAVFLSPGLLLAAGCVYAPFRSSVPASALAALLCGGAALMVCGLVFYCIIVQRYMLAPKILALAPKAKIRDVIYASTELSQGSCRRAAALKMSFLPWLVSCLLVVPAAYAVPYYRQSCSCFAADVLEVRG